MPAKKLPPSEKTQFSSLSSKEKWKVTFQKLKEKNLSHEIESSTSSTSSSHATPRQLLQPSANSHEGSTTSNQPSILCETLPSSNSNAHEIHQILTLESHVKQLREKIEKLSQIKVEESLDHLQQCLTERRLLQEVLLQTPSQVIEQIQEVLNESDTLFEQEWKPKVVEFFDHNREKMQEMMFEMDSQSASLSEHLQLPLQDQMDLHEVTSWWNHPLSLKLLLGIGLGAMTGLAFKSFFSSSQQQPASTSSSSITTDVPDTSTSISMINQIHHHMTYQELIMVDDQQKLEWLLELEEMLSYF